MSEKPSSKPEKSPNNLRNLSASGNSGNLGDNEGSSPTPSSSSADHPEPSDRYFCHVCDVAVTNIANDFTCPRCRNGFLEKIETGAHGGIAEEQEPYEDEQGQVPMNFLQNILDAVLQHQGGFQGAAQQNISGGPAQRQQSQQQQAGQAPPYVQQFMQNLLQNLGNMQVQFQFGDGEGIQQIGFPLHGNPGDYAWGPGGVDNIVTQLLNQIEGGVPPMAQEKIEKIPAVEISQKQVDNKAQCTTCMDEFTLKEKVKELPCRHCFHEQCIVPWLQRHDTCPICRKSADASKWNSDRTELLSNLSGSNSSTQNANPQNSTGPVSNQSARSMMDAIDELD